MSERDTAIVPTEYVNPAELKKRIVDLEGQVKQLHDRLSQQADAYRFVMAAAFRSVADALSGVENLTAENSAASPQSNVKWAQWKTRLSPRAGEVIDFLLVAERATIRQIGAAIKSDPRTVSKGPIYEMNKIGLLVKNGDAYSLKQI